MSSRPLQSVRELDRGAVVALARRGVRTCGTVTLMPSLHVMNAIGGGAEDAEALMRCVCKIVRPAPRTALDMLRGLDHQSVTSLPTGLPTLDAALSGGVPCDSVTELVGPAGVGKTQMSMTMVVAASVPTSLGGYGDQCSMLYLDTENKFSSLRLVEIATERFPQHYCAGSGGGEGLPEVSAKEAKSRLQRLTSRVHVYRINTPQELVSCVKSLDKAIIEHGARLVVLDSIASVLRRGSGQRAGFAQRHDLLAGTAAALKSIADTFHIPVVVTNQVTTTLQAGLQPALGNTWAHCVNTRLVLEAGRSSPDTRSMTLSKSHMAAKLSISYRIQGCGVVEVDPASRARGAHEADADTTML